MAQNKLNKLKIQKEFNAVIAGGFIAQCKVRKAS